MKLILLKLKLRQVIRTTKAMQVIKQIKSIRRTIKAIRSGGHNSSIRTIKIICEYLNITPDEFLGIKKYSPSNEKIINVYNSMPPCLKQIIKTMYLFSADGSIL